MNAIQSRQACMKANGASMGVMVPMIKGEKAYDGAAVQEALAKAEAACAGWAGWWGEDTKSGGATETWAKDEIWTDMAGFEAAGGKYVAAFGALKASTDEASFKAAFGDFGGTCKGCHEQFRRPKQ
ncbi:MAG: cytochrome c [Alphaproteobacteria bacterium]|nr:cytochrome c [Alphaproteobacteria bacterium]